MVFFVAFSASFPKAEQFLLSGGCIHITGINAVLDANVVVFVARVVVLDLYLVHQLGLSVLVD